MRLKRIVAIVLAVMLLSLCFTGCGEDTTYIAEVNGEKIPVGVYIFSMMNSYTAAINSLTQSGVPLEKAEDVLKQQIEGIDASQWIINETVTLVRQYLTIIQKFDEFGLSLTEEQKAKIETTHAEAWDINAEYFEKNGVSETSVKMVIEASMKLSAMFDYFYAEGGKEAVSKEDILKHFNENYAKVTYFGTYTAEMDDAKKAEVKTAFENYVTQLNEGGNFAEIVAEVQKAQLTGEALENFEPDLTITEESYADMVKKGDTTYYVQEFLDAVFAAENDTWFFTEIAPAYFAIKKIDVSENEEVYEQYKDEVLAAMKQPELEEKINAWADEYNVALNEAAINKFIPKKLKLN